MLCSRGNVSSKNKTDQQAEEARNLFLKKAACEEPVRHRGERSVPVTDVHQTKLEMKRARCSGDAWLGHVWISASLGSLLQFPQEKTTMNISEQEINKSRININAPKSMPVVFKVPLKVLIPVSGERTTLTKHQRLDIPECSFTIEDM